MLDKFSKSKCWLSYKKNIFWFLPRQRRNNHYLISIESSSWLSSFYQAQIWTKYFSLYRSSVKANQRNFTAALVIWGCQIVIRTYFPEIGRCGTSFSAMRSLWVGGYPSQDCPFMHHDIRFAASSIWYIACLGEAKRRAFLLFKLHLLVYR